MKNIEQFLSAKIVKRSVKIAGHSTSITMEEPFLDKLIEIADNQGRSINELVAEIDEIRSISLSSACRMYVLASLSD